jgi:heme exporter protein B
MLKVARFLFHTELTLLLRRSQEWLYPLSFFVIVICLFPLAFTSNPIFLKKFIPGYLWVSALLASLLSIEHVFFTDIEEGILEQMLLSPIPLTVILTVKLSAQWLITELPLILLTPLLGWVFHLSIATTLVLCISLLLGTPILILIGCVGVSLTLGLRQQGILLSLLILPLATPVLIFGTVVAQQSQAGLSVAAPLLLLGGCCILALTLLPCVIAAALRASMDD